MSEASESEIFKRLNDLENSYSEMKGMLAVMSKGYNRAVMFLGFLAVVGWFVVAYGAIGKDGMNSVRQSLPLHGGQQSSNDAYPIPAPPDGLDRWRART